MQGVKCGRVIKSQSSLFETLAEKLQLADVGKDDCRKFSIWLFS